ncbi:MAG: FliH/SctL family protein [Fibromonadales bacterium]|nr:FliH/SctL family protein [Fibromonadales bacterium]
MSKKEEEQPGKVQLKAILKGNAAQAVRPAAMSGFKVADFQMNPMATVETPEERTKNELAALQSQIAALHGEIANLKTKSEQDVKASHDKGVQEGKKSGSEEGEKKALEKWNADLKALRENAAKELDNLATQQKENFDKISAETTEIALAVAKRIFCEEAAQNPNIISRVLKEAFVFLGQEEKLRVRINPADIASAEETQSFWKPVMSSLKSVDLIPDETIEQGGCLLESENGSSVDMRLQTIFGHINEAVKQIFLKP